MSAEPHVLELRVHGVNNTAPYDLLEVPQEDVERSRGDSAGSFWTPTASSMESARERLAAAGGEPVPPDYVPPSVRREAYSWGPMARESGVPTWAASNSWAVRLSRAGWMLLIPFGLTNAAYWTRSLRAREPDGTPQYARGARSLRLFGFGLTLLWVAAAETIACWLLATQCLAGGPVKAVCRELPGWLEGMSTYYTWPQRMALGSLVPVALLLVLWWLSRGSRLRYETSTSSATAPRGGTAGRDAGPVPALADPSLWSRWALTRSWSLTHLAGGFALVALFAAISQGWSRDPACQTVSTTVANLGACLPVDGATGWSQLALGLGALLALLWAAWAAATTTADQLLPGSGSRRRVTIRLLLAVAVLILAAELVLLTRFEDATERTSLPGIDLIQGVLLVILLLIAMSALTWRGPVRAIAAATGLGWLLAGCLLWAVLVPDTQVALWAAGALAVAFTAVCVVGAGRRRAEAWLGRGPGVMLLLALGIAVAGAGVVVVAVGDWLNGGAAAADLSPAVREASDGSAGPSLRVPITYVESAVASVIALALALLLLAGYLGSLWVRGRLIGPIPEPTSPGRTALVRAMHDRSVLQPAGRLTELRARADLGALRQRMRSLAALSQRAVALVAPVAIAMAVGLTITVILSVDDAMHADAGPALTLVDEPWFAPLAAIGLWTNSVLFAALLIRVVTAPDEQKGRPIALTWDLMCFLPRGGHPLGPPCYAERAVPELAARVDAWLEGLDLPQGSRHVGRRRVVISAHSLGCVLAVAALFARSSGRVADPRSTRVALLTFGSQLRPYFGRILPEMLGPDVLGTPPCTPGTTGPDPWARSDPPHDAGPWPAPESGTLLDRLTSASGGDPRWVNLWRRTDFLGMPVYAYADNPVDRPAEEIDATGYVPVIGTHSNYPRTAEYRHAMEDLVERLGR